MRHAFEPCPDDQAFHFAHGSRARSLEELRVTMDDAPPEVVYYHREHFPHWVRDVLGDPSLADRIASEGRRAQDGEHLRNRLDQVLDRALDQLRSGPVAPSTTPAPRGTSDVKESAGRGRDPPPPEAAASPGTGPAAASTSPSAPARETRRPAAKAGAKAATKGTAKRAAKGAGKEGGKEDRDEGRGGAKPSEPKAAKAPVKGPRKVARSEGGRRRGGAAS